MDCPGRCPRSARPLACRIFPLLPVIKAGRLTVEEDLRGRGLCPLTDGAMTHIEENFRRAVLRAAEILMKSAENRRFIEELSALQAELSSFF